MTRRLAVVVTLFGLLPLPSAALASGAFVGSFQGGSGVLSRDGSVRYVALGAGSHTVLEAVSTKDGSVVRSADLYGSWGIPGIGLDGTTGGLSRDGRTLVVGSTSFGPSSSFLVLDARTLRMTGSVDLRGTFGYDALSPDARMLYLIRTLSLSNASRYVVRAYDLRTSRLLPGRIADRTQKSWVMQGYPETRATSADGRWVFTLYQNPGGYPFVHALDTVNGVAHCVGLPFTGDQSVLFNLRLTLHDGGRTLAVHWRSGRPWLNVAVGSWRISYPRGGMPWRWVGSGIAAALALLAATATLLLRRRRLREELHEDSRQELGLA
jgi:hypothetical protein